MSRLFKFVFRTIFLIKILSLAFSAGMGMAYLFQLRAQYRSWGLVEGGNERGVSGDELVAEPHLIETRAIDIDASPEQVWPWLVQLGYGRGGWYSYPLFDRPWMPGEDMVTGESAETILEEFQDLAEGDLVPTAPSAGFEARVVEPDEALVLYLDDSTVSEQVSEMMTDATDAADEATKGAVSKSPQLDLDVDLSMPPYRVSWAFELQPLAGDRTRLIERLRANIEASDVQWRARPALAMGVFVLLRSQLQGIKRRAEENATES